jgi:hypothetical protein
VFELKFEMYYKTIIYVSFYSYIYLFTETKLKLILFLYVNFMNFEFIPRPTSNLLDPSLIRKEGNHIAHTLSRVAMVSVLDKQWLDKPFDYIKEILLIERVAPSL